LALPGLGLLVLLWLDKEQSIKARHLDRLTAELAERIS
jgi:hypothetical protein